MPPAVAIVTDSTAYLPPVSGVTVVPLEVIIGGTAYHDGDQLDAARMLTALKDWVPVTTSRPAPQHFADVYEAAAAHGATGVVSIHLSGELSGTVASARIAAADSLIPVEIVDSRSIAMGLGFPVLAAVSAAAKGATLTEVAATARRVADAARTFFYVDTLEYLRRGGRVGSAATLVGSALMIKPLLHLSRGAIVPLEKVRTVTRAIARLEDLVVETAGNDPVEIAVQHLSARGRAEALAERLAQRLPKLTGLRVLEVGAVIGVHVGPGSLGVTVSPSS